MGTEQQNAEYGADQIQILEAWRQSAKDRECTSEALPYVDFIIWCMRS